MIESEHGFDELNCAEKHIKNIYSRCNLRSLCKNPKIEENELWTF